MAPSKRTTHLRLVSGRSTRALAITIATDGSLPKEFRLFTSGWNDTENGRYLFDEEAARLTMAAYEKWGVDLMIDLEHQALNASTPPDPNARDARGWCKLELRPDGSLWAVNVSWTEDGAQRLLQKRQRYVSPAFSVDPETSRVISIINVALVAIPATHDTPALVAASARGAMTKESIQKAIDALIAEDAAAALEILKGLVVEAATGEETTTEDPPPAPLEETEIEMAPEKPKEENEEVVAASTRLMRLTGAKSLAEVVTHVETFRTSHLELEEGRQQLAKERAILESAERRQLCVDLVVKASRAPAEVWADDKAKTPKKYLSAMPIEDLRELVADAIKTKPAAKSSTGSGALAPPSNVIDLSEREKELCKSKKIDPATYVAIKNQVTKKA